MLEESRKEARGGDVNVVGLVAIIAVALTAVIVAALVLVATVAPDTWEADNAYDLIAMVNEADSLGPTDQLAAYKKCDLAL